MVLPNSILLFPIPFFFTPYFGNGIATNQLQIFFPSYFDNAIAIILLYFLKKIFFLKKWYVHTIFIIFLQQILSDRSLLLD